MPNWSNVLNEIAQLQATSTESPFDKVRRKYLRYLQKHTGRNVIAYYSSFLSKPRLEGIQINDEDKNGFMLCIHKLDRTKGLDLILHTPGGDSQATISLVDYLRSMFGNDMRAIVPQIAMSAGTMIACSCKEILMGKHSSLGPVDPQFGVVAAANLLEEVKKAKAEITANPNSALFWAHILQQITPSFLERCEWAIKDSNEFLAKTLAQNMFSHLPQAEADVAIAKISAVFANNLGRAHNTHIQYQECKDVGLNVRLIEADDKLQDLVLTIHHCYMHTLTNTPSVKLIENQKGNAIVRQQQQQQVFSIAPAAGPQVQMLPEEAQGSVPTN